MKKKLKIIGPVLLLLVVGGIAYKMFLAPKPVEAKRKVEGALFTLQPEFVVNLAGGRYGKLTVALLLAEAPVAGKEAAAAGPQLEQNDVVRSVVTDTLTGTPADDLINRRKRIHVLERVLRSLHARTDEHVKKVFFTDIAVQ